MVAPGPKAGRGLKREYTAINSKLDRVAPGPKAGRGLKHDIEPRPENLRPVAPGPKAGRGLKLGIRHAIQAAARSARPQSRARIETPAVRPFAACHRVAPGPKAGRGLKLSLAR